MPYSAPFELLTDALGAVTFGWADEGVYYARFSRCLSAKLGEAFAARLRAAAQTASTLKYFADARALESFDLLARSAFVRVVAEQRRKFEQLHLLTFAPGELNAAFVNALGQPLLVTKDAIEFETCLLASAPRARVKLGPPAELEPRSRWPLRR